MSDLLSELASKANVSNDQAKQGLGAFLSFLKEQLPPEDAAKVEAEIPHGGEALSAFEANKQEAEGGLLSSIGGLVKSVFGGGKVSELSKRFGQVGFSVDQLKDFLPALLELLKKHIPGDLVAKIKDMVPGFSKEGT